MTTIFKGTTNGGANRFFIKDEKIMVAGADVKGRQEVDLEILEDVWGFDTKATGNLTGDIDAGQIRVFEIKKDGEGTGDFRVVIGGESVGGQFKFDFTDDFYKDVNANRIEAKLEDSGITTDGSVDSRAEGAAINFALFLEEMLNADALAFIDAAGANTDKITNIDGALSQLNDNDIRDDNTVKIAGNGVSGATFTDPFPSEGAAENFIDTVQLANADGNGFLDDILV